MRSRFSILVPVVIAAFALSAVAWAYPKPSAYPVRWELQFTTGPLRLHLAESGQAYWFMTYEVANRTGREQVWAPTFTLYTDAGEILVSGRRVPSRVTEQLMGLLGDPLLENQHAVIGEIHHGAEHAKSGLVVWPAGNLEVNQLAMFVAGISGETAAVINPITAEEIVLRKTLRRDYLIPGEALPRGSEPAGQVSESWVMR